MERIAITARLNRSTLQLDDAAFARLEQYLAESASLLEGDPDPQEILADLEQAVADKCVARLGRERSIVTLAELEPALAEIGSVQVPGPSPSAAQSTPAQNRPLQQVSEGAVVSGVCLGFARYFGLNVTALRVLAVVLVLLSGGGMIAVYAVLMVLLPYAPRDTSRPIGWLPAKSRELVEFLRSKFRIATS